MVSPMAKTTLVLPTESTKPTKVWADQKFLMLGAGKIGKSAFWAQDKEALFLEFEPGLNHLEVKKVPCRSWDDVRQVYQLLAEAKPFPYQTLVVDTIDMFLTRAGEEVVMRAKGFFSANVASKINTIGDIPEGKGWFQHKELIRMTLDKLTQLPCALVLIGHVSNKEIKEPTRVYHKNTINIGGQVGTALLHWADHTLHIQSRMMGDKLERTIRTLPSESLEAGSRGGVVPDQFKLEPDEAANFSKFRALFD